MPLNMLQIAKRSRRRPQPGDIFVFQMRPDRLFRYGRVIRTDTNIGLDEGNTILVYIYKASSPQKTPVPLLVKTELLLPPMGVNESGWYEGYFETVEQKTLEVDDVLPVHCFSRSSTKTPYVDADGKPLSHRNEPCGIYAIGGYGAVDLEASIALSFPDPTDDSPTTSTAAGHSEENQNYRGGDGTVTLYLATPPAGPLVGGFPEFEDRMIEVIERAKVGQWNGHEFAIDGSYAAVFFSGPNADRLMNAVHSVARGSAPKGSYLLKRYDEPGAPEERVDI